MEFHNTLNNVVSTNLVTKHFDFVVVLRDKERNSIILTMEDVEGFRYIHTLKGITMMIKRSLGTFNDDTVADGASASGDLQECQKV